MYQRVLVPLDGSAFGDRAIPLALQIAGRTGAHVDLVHIHMPGREDLSAITPYQFEQVTSRYAERDQAELGAEREQIREKAESLAREAGLVVTGSVVFGAVAEMLTNLAESSRADLIVMATHGRTGFARARLGSMADMVVRHASMPVLLVHPEPDGSIARAPLCRRILVPLDGSDFSEEVLQPATDFARLYDAEVMLVHVVDHRAKLPNAYLDPARATGVLLRHGGRIETVLAAHVVDGILDAAERMGADLIAMATHGRGGLTRLVMGSTASDLISRTHLPVLLRRPGISAPAFQGQSIAAELRA